MQTEADRWKDIKSLAIAVLPWLLIGFLVWRFAPPELLTRRYGNNIFILPSGGLKSFYLLAIIATANIFPRSLFMIITLLAVGIAAVALIINAFGSSHLSNFYISYAFCVAVAGMVLDYLLYWQKIRIVNAPIRDTKSDVGSGAIHMGLLLCVAVFIAVVIAVAAFLVLRDGHWREILRPEWPGWPYVACLLWGWLSSRLVRFKEVMGAVKTPA